MSADHDERRRHVPGDDRTPEQSHGGNETVNDGPDGLSENEARVPSKPTGRDAAAKDLGGSGGSGGFDGLDRLRAAVRGTDEPGGTGSDDAPNLDESDLRQLLQDAVQDIEPREGTLEHLRRAVPARRARKRQALVGMAAAALFVGTAVPALVHVSQSTGSGANPSVAGHGTHAQGGATQGLDPDAGDGSSAGAADKSEQTDPGGGKKETGGEQTGGDPSGGSADPQATADAGGAVCTAEQLTVAGASAGTQDAGGAVYGTFRFSNASTSACTVTSPGTLSVVPGGAADPTKLSQARHTSGDPATSLPDPSEELTSLILQPGTAYEVKFAWVPSETCPTTGGNTGGTVGGGGDPSPDPTPSSGTGTTDGTSTGGDTGTSTQLLTADGPADGTVTITNTPDPGSPPAQTTIPNACAGTVYWTGVLAGA
ncbi:hypothetical protein QNN03_03190 [Streptomyces sp. GXMU-J15]|uniref:DUF4232 domain-containing protein n=1 Tax=Streptomyces fuscus TaxID=3048495 RepID=A0ABT7IS76_9ACTN|nr:MULTISPECIES: hypothetical protein [Streptomyces]MDL2075441.1 hypothetical protein [Streptomyces fuscus]